MTRRPRTSSLRADRRRHLSAAPDDTHPDDADASPGRAAAPVMAVARIDTAALTPDQHAAAVTALAALIHTWHRASPTRHRTKPRPDTRPGTGHIGAGRAEIAE